MWIDSALAGDKGYLSFVVGNARYEFDSAVGRADWKVGSAGKGSAEKKVVLKKVVLER